MDDLKVAIVGLGKIGLPLAAQYAAKGAFVIGCDVDEGVVGAVNAGRCPISGEPGLAEAVAAARNAGRLRATTDTLSAVFESDVVVVIVPVGIDGGPASPAGEHRTDFTNLDAAVAALAGGLRKGQLVILESTVPVGATRDRFGRDLALGSGLKPEEFDLAYSPERVSSGQVFRDLATYPKVLGGATPAAAERAAAFFRRMLGVEVIVLPDVETAEFTKLAESVYRDVNIALANELALAAEALGIDYAAAARAANSQPFSHLHAPGVGVGGHCIPVYPYFLLETSPALRLVAQSRAVNDSMAEHAVARLEEALAAERRQGRSWTPATRVQASGNEAPEAPPRVAADFSPQTAPSQPPRSVLAGETVLILGLAYRGGVKEATLSSTHLLARALERRGARVLVHDPLFSDEEIRAYGLEPTPLPPRSEIAACILQAAHPEYAALDPRVLEGCRVFLDGRAGFDRARVEAAGLRYLAIGLGR